MDMHLFGAKPMWNVHYSRILVLCVTFGRKAFSNSGKSFQPDSVHVLEVCEEFPQFDHLLRLSISHWLESQDSKTRVFVGKSIGHIDRSRYDWSKVFHFWDPVHWNTPWFIAFLRLTTAGT